MKKMFILATALLTFAAVDLFAQDDVGDTTVVADITRVAGKGGIVYEGTKKTVCPIKDTALCAIIEDGGNTRVAGKGGIVYEGTKKTVCPIPDPELCAIIEAGGNTRVSGKGGIVYEGTKRTVCPIQDTALCAIIEPQPADTVIGLEGGMVTYPVRIYDMNGVSIYTEPAPTTGILLNDAVEAMKREEAVKREAEENAVFE